MPDALPPADLPPDEFALRIEREFAVPPERVFDAFTDPGQVAQWWGPEGMTCPHCDVDARPGGRYRTCIRQPGGAELWVGGVYREVERPRRLVFTWAWETDGVPGHEMLIALSFEPTPNGTRLALLQTNFANADARDRHEHGWISSFNCLDAFLSGGNP